jgi:hypothetical protein
MKVSIKVDGPAGKSELPNNLSVGLKISPNGAMSKARKREGILELHFLPACEVCCG